MEEVHRIETFVPPQDEGAIQAFMRDTDGHVPSRSHTLSISLSLSFCRVCSTAFIASPHSIAQGVHSPDSWYES